MAWIDCAGKGSPSWAVAVEDEVFIVINQPESSDESEVYMSLNEGLLDPESPDYVHLRRTFVLSTLVEFFQGERHFSSSKHPYGYWNQYGIGLIVTYGNLGILRSQQKLKRKPEALLAIMR
ncbi:uncharacterized protein [Vicugna pacos]|uniref:Uncharacterized protein isoform X1 n=1 Tax=Vicugna pacos TaxID=30538 RepID=A0ABM5DM54_VICPA